MWKVWKNKLKNWKCWALDSHRVDDNELGLSDEDRKGEHNLSNNISRKNNENDISEGEHLTLKWKND